ncbi:hypothetical protein F4861DRAFT_31002 [Xylaria intraflava]|nr:hypothetical protein F4861DRAFT_31002 [Xylaria intraflava]
MGREMMVSRNSPSRPSFEILCDSRMPLDQRESTPIRSPLGHLSVFQSPDCQLQPVRTCAGIHESNQASRNLYSGVIHKNNKDKLAGSRLTRPSITPDTFEVLGTVAEAAPRIQSVPAAARLSNHAQQVLQLSVEKDSNHPLSVAAHNIPPLKEQLAKHCDGLFEWILAVRVPTDPKSQRDLSSGVDTTGKARRRYFGCNLLPHPSPEEKVALGTAGVTGNYYLVVTPLAETEDVLEIFSDPIGDPNMAAADATSVPGTPVKISDYGSIYEVGEATPSSTLCTRGDESLMDSLIPRSPAQPVTRIEDSFEALDILEDQLEAFDQEARFNRYLSIEKVPSNKGPANLIEPASPSPSVRFATPQSQQAFAKSSPVSLRAKQVTQQHTTALRKATSMTLDPYRHKSEDQAQSRTISKTSIPKGTTKSTAQKPGQAIKSTKQLTVPAFELPGDAVARELKAKKEARLASQRATQPTAASLSRAKSLKLPTRPTFELPGEAISRRKREEHLAQLKTQEEEDKKRREFKARPVPSHVAPTTIPRDTITSRARQGKPALTENSTQVPASTKASSATLGSFSRSALASTINRSLSRGRGPVGGGSIQASRATSTSTGSVSDRRSPLSTEDVQMQKLRGQEIYRRDNSWANSRMREKQERETLAKLAREEAAERSRQKSREWAAKQAKRRTAADGSLRDSTD